MADRQKVIKGLEETEIILTQAVDRGGEMAVMGAFKCLNSVTDALALLKEQEAVEPEVEVMNEIDRLYRCPKCHKCFFYEKQKYCDQCGQAVKLYE